MTEVDVIALQNITCIRGDIELFQGLDLQVASGELLHLLGENGSGKTSLLRIIAGISSPDSGEILWNQTSITNSNEFSHQIAYLAHRDGIKFELSAFENLKFYQQLHHKYDQQIIFEILEKLDIKHITFTPAKELSFGQKRRLGFARLLLSPAKIWLLDEPFTGVDVSGRELMESHCLHFLNEGGMIIMTHHADIDNQELSMRSFRLDLSDFYHNKNFSSH